MAGWAMKYGGEGLGPAPRLRGWPGPFLKDVHPLQCGRENFGGLRALGLAECIGLLASVENRSCRKDRRNRNRTGYCPLLVLARFPKRFATIQLLQKISDSFSWEAW